MVRHDGGQTRRAPGRGRMWRAQRDGVIDFEFFRKRRRLAAGSSFGMCQEQVTVALSANGSNRPFSVTQLRIRNGSSCPKAARDSKQQSSFPKGWRNQTVESLRVPPVRRRALRGSSHPSVEAGVRVRDAGKRDQQGTSIGSYPGAASPATCDGAPPPEVDRGRDRQDRCHQPIPQGRDAGRFGGTPRGGVTRARPCRFGWRAP